MSHTYTYLVVQSSMAAGIICRISSMSIGRDFYYYNIDGLIISWQRNINIASNVSSTLCTRRLQGKLYISVYSLENLGISIFRGILLLGIVN